MSKIIFLNRYFHPDHSATSVLTSDLAFRLAEKGFEVHALASRSLYGDAKADLPRREETSGVQIRRVSATAFGRGNPVRQLTDLGTFYLSATFSLLRMVSRGDVIVSETDPPLISIAAAIVAKLKGAALVNWVQDIFPEISEALSPDSKLLWLVKPVKPFRNFSWRAARINVALGQRMADLLLQQGVAQEQIRVIHNWSDGDFLQPIARESNPLRKKWGLEGKFVVGHSGNMGMGRDFDTLLDMAESLSQNEDVVFLMIGGGWQRKNVEREVAGRGLKNVVLKDLVPREQLRESLSVPDLHIVTLRPELEGLVVPSKFYGIAAVGRPCLYIGDPDGEIPRILEAENCGVTIPNGGTEIGWAFIEKLAGDAEYRASLGARARSSFDKRFAGKIAREEWEKALVDAGAERKSPAP